MTDEQPEEVSAGAPRPGRLRALAAVLTITIAILGLYVGKSVMQESAIRLPFDTILQTRDVLPQGWTFFTRSPREANTTFWNYKDGVWSEIRQYANAEPTHFFGLSRATRADSIRASSLVSEAALKKVTFAPCENLGYTEHDVSTCIDALEPVILDRSAFDWDLCGPVAAIAREPLPWAWAQAGSTTTMPAMAIRFEVTCA